MARTMPMRASSLLLAMLLLLAALSFQACSGHGGINDGDGQVDAPATPASSSSGVRSKGLIAVKVWCLVILLVFTFLGGVSPYFYRWNDSFLLLGTQFAAGVFLGTSLMHFLADSTATFKGLTSNQYPFSFMLTCVGFLLTMLSDLVIAAVARRSGGVSNNQVSEQQAEGEYVDAEASGAVSRKEDAAAVAHPAMLVRTSSFEDAVLLIVALCFHSVFEGIAIGVSATKSEAWRNLWTIGLHKIFAAVAMGIALLRMIPKRPFLMTIVYSLAFAVSSPVGVGVGIAIDATAEGRPADWTYAISMGLATGVFIYVAINHLIAKGYRPNQPTAADKPAFKFLAVLLGIAVMAVVMIWD
uniref:Zinc transporter n=1 Tax=Oryza punctata TaxID=4537 RepID=A0A0E0JU84_ORYPU